MDKKSWITFSLVVSIIALWYMFVDYYDVTPWGKFRHMAMTKE